VLGDGDQKLARKWRKDKGRLGQRRAHGESTIGQGNSRGDFKRKYSKKGLKGKSKNW